MSVLRPACLSDVQSLIESMRHNFASGLCPRCYDSIALERLYDAEWRKRGYERSP